MKAYISDSGWQGPPRPSLPPPLPASQTFPRLPGPRQTCWFSLFLRHRRLGALPVLLHTSFLPSTRSFRKISIRPWLSHYLALCSNATWLPRETLPDLLSLSYLAFSCYHLSHTPARHPLSSFPSNYHYLVLSCLFMGLLVYFQYTPHRI